MTSIFKYAKAFATLFLMLFNCAVMAQLTVQIGTGTQAPLTNSSIYSPICRFSATTTNDASRSNLLYTASELNGVGITNGATINKIAFYKIGTGASTAGFTFQIYMRNSTIAAPLATTTTWASILTTHTPVYATTTQSIPATSGWVEFTLTTPFLYNGQNLEIAMSHDMSGVSGDPTTGPFDWQYTNGFQDYIIGNVGTTPGATLNGTVTNYKVRPNIQFTFSAGAACTNPVTAGTSTASSASVCPSMPVTLNLSGSSIGAGLTFEWESSPNNTTYASISSALLGAAFSYIPTATAWYRCKVICSGGTPVYSTPIQVVVPSPLNGIYTINNTTPTTATNFNSFTEAINALNCVGVSGQVTFNVSAGTPYVETLNFGVINGASLANNIRFNGNGAIVQFTNTTTDRQLLTLDGTKYVRIDSLSFKTIDATFGWGARITGGASHDSITRCVFDISSVTSTTAANVNGIVFSASATAATTSGVNGTNMYIANNYIKGSSGAGGLNYGIGIAAGGSDSNIIINNVIENFYNNGMYIASAKYTLIEGNEIHRANKTTGIVASEGIHTVSGDMSGSKIIGNRIHSPGGTVGATTVFRGLSLLGDGTATEPVVIANNIIYNINQGGASSGIYVSAGLYLQIYHNTVSFDQVMTGTAINYGIYTTGTNTSTDIVNNLVSITAGSGGVKYGFYYNTAPSVNDAQKNNIYLNSSQAGVQNYGYYTAAYLTQAAFQTAHPTLEIGSPTIDPQFTAPLIGNFLPGNAALYVAGNNLLASVPADINGTPRSATPTIGAYESIPTNFNDASAMALLNPTGLFCAGSKPVEVVIRNAGANNINNLQVNWSVNGVVQTPLAYVGLLVPSTASTGQNMDTVILGNANLTAGINFINVWTSLPNGAVDNNITNDSVLTSLTTTNFTATALFDTGCANAPITVNLNPSTGYTNETINWQSSTDGTTWTNISGASTEVLTLPGISQNTHFRASVTNNGVVCLSNSDSIVIISPLITSTTPAERCGPGIVNLNAVGSASIVNWYDVATGGSPIATGSSFTTSSIANSTTYYVSTSTAPPSTQVVYNLANLTPQRNWHTNTTGWGAMFTVNQSCVLDSLTIYPLGTGTITLYILDQSNNVLQTGTPISVTGTGFTGTPVRIPAGFSLAPGNYKLGQSVTGLTNLGSQNIGTIGYPFSSPALTITSGSQGAGAVANVFYWFYNWRVTVGAASNGCESPRVPVIATINPAPVVNLGNNINLCPNESVTIDGTSATPGVTYLWNTAETTPTISVNNPGTYSVTVDDGSCSTSDTIVVNAVPNPVAVLNDTVSICSGDMTTLDAGNAGASFLWSNTSTSQTIDVSTGGNYSVAITNGFNCSIEDSIFVVVNDLPIVDLGNDTMVCAGTPLTLDAENIGASYLWSTGAQTQSINVNQGGTYSVTVTNGFHCSASDEITIEEFTPATVDGFSFVPRYDLEQGRVDFFPINPVFADSYHWDFGDGNTSTLETPINVYAANGNYLVTLTIINECGSMDTSLMINVDLFVGVKPVGKSDIQVNVYPVPSSDVLNIEIANGASKIQSLKVFNAIGQEVLYNAQVNSNKSSINVNALAEGNYFIIIDTNEGKAYRKFNIIR